MLGIPVRTPEEAPTLRPRRRRAEVLERSHSRMGNARAWFLFGLLAVAAVLCRTQSSWGVALMLLLLGLVLTGIWHMRIENARNAARRGIRFYQSGLERLDGTWLGKGSPGMEFFDSHHPYAADLDMFGVGSLFELINAAHTQIGRTTLAAWLLEPASPEEIVARQEAIKELGPKVDLRERLGFLAAEAQAWIPTGGNPLIAALRGWFLLETQIAFAVETWRARFGMMVEPWLRSLGEIEALSSLAGYAFEHPADPFPEFLPASAPAEIQAEGLKHPLMAEARCVGNDVSLGPDRRLIVVSGSNMSGKSTYLRTLGVNLALALAGAPVRAQKFRMTHLRIGASIRTVDSLQEGISRFYAEIIRLGQIVKLAGQGTPLVFLLDEILGGTNSHDRRIGAGCVARHLVERGALGLITTHDLALAQIAEEIQPPGANYHFVDQILNGKMSFDYRLRPGVVQKSNALELMRLVGLDVTG